MFNQAIADRICARLAEGESLRKAAKAENANARTVLDWVESNEAFAAQYAHSRARGYQLLADEIIEISDEADVQIRETEAGGSRLELDATAVARNRLRVDSRKWMLSKMLPKVYGDKLDVQHKGGLTVKLETGDDAL